MGSKFEAEEMLVVFEAIGKVIGFGYLIGSLKEIYDWNIDLIYILPVNHSFIKFKQIKE